MDVELKCPCGAFLALHDAPEVMACNTVYEWSSAHSPCLINYQSCFTADDPEDEDDEDDEDAGD